jgi:hypothetical protein
MDSGSFSEIRRQWAGIALPDPVTGELHSGGPEGSWLSISLQEPCEPRAWLHFRQSAASVECAIGYDGLAADGLQWKTIDPPAAGAVMAAFAEMYIVSRGAHAGLASPPCSMPELD